MLVDEIAQQARVHDVKIDNEIVPVLDEREVHVRHPVDEHEINRCPQEPRCTIPVGWTTGLPGLVFGAPRR
jgi:hypothetical protein